MATSETKKIKKQETLVRFSIISYKTRLRVAGVVSFRISLGGPNASVLPSSISIELSSLRLELASILEKSSQRFLFH